ncbi:seryl-tRNA synthetase [Thecamonas trahens ATCC 50062]|uniref:serine--tRNA ligase n=1 Tax=Thecamonas trahens ATCC 50062 TaxID=461836 RepID=A0A0L0DS30_THETB|nr:seryl-tRNA synthetase [Thecamonas trahens ATCC 50062]KNC55124.1 seryl-tRNA synthetase [Thecamonas trahens ATCC 50062]|eukprot:XP_013753304.1 seryl-tRNA synthetase [Thecamonas trahens ATCC 50062]
MLDLATLRHSPQSVEHSLAARGYPSHLLDDALAADAAVRGEKARAQELRVSAKALQADIAAAYKSNRREAASELVAERQALKDELAALDASLAEHLAARAAALAAIPNLVDTEVPAELTVVRSLVASRDSGYLAPTDLHRHHVLLHMIGGADFARGAKVAGSRGYFLCGPGLALNRALASYGLAFLAERGFAALAPPLMMADDMLTRAGQLGPAAEAALFTLSNRQSLIPSAEQPLAALHAGELLDADLLPLRYAGFSQCFRAEASERSASGLYRVHVFDKVEQFVIAASQSDARAELDSMVDIALEFYASLELSTRLVAMPAADLSHAAALKFDIEAEFAAAPEFAPDRWGELVSASSCTDYQARALDVRTVPSPAVCPPPV